MVQLGRYDRSYEQTATHARPSPSYCRAINVFVLQQFFVLQAGASRRWKAIYEGASVLVSPVSAPDVWAHQGCLPWMCS